jgi:hypothetical protein
MDMESKGSGSGDSASELYEMGQRMIEMAKAMGYKEEAEQQSEVMPQPKKKGGMDKFDMAMSVLD